MERRGTDDRSRHAHTGDADWSELWHFDWVLSADPWIGGFVRYAVQPNQRRTQFWSAVVGSQRPYVLCRDGELQLPPQPSVLEVRGGALWTHAICETPLEHWTVAMEAYALTFDDPYEAWHTERGDRIGLAFDLEWELEDEAVESTVPGAIDGTYLHGFSVDCQVHGDLMVGDDTIAVAAHGRRFRGWGPWTGESLLSGSADHTHATWARAPVLVETPTGPIRALFEVVGSDDVLGAYPTNPCWIERTDHDS